MSLIDTVPTGGCWDCAYLNVTGLSFVDSAVCRHKSVQESMLLRRKRYLKKELSGCKFQSETIEQPSVGLGRMGWEEAFSDAHPAVEGASPLPPTMPVKQLSLL